jgi:glycerate 2-kinase
VSDANQIIRNAFAAALHSVEPEVAVSRALSSNESLGNLENASVDVIAIGKAAIPMARGAVTVLGTQIRRIFVITKDDHDLGPVPAKWIVRFAAHPVLDQRTVAATTELITWLNAMPPSETTVCLISGGGSALLELPMEGISLGDMQVVTRLLLAAGADIYQLNAVRSRLSQVKGGGLRRKISGQRCVSLLLSDVLGNDPTVIASGPTVPLRSTLEEAREVISQFDLAARLPESVQQQLAHESESDEWTYGRDSVHVVADNDLAVKAAAHALETTGRTISVAWTAQTGEAATRAVEWIDIVSSISPSVDAILGGGELTVTINGAGNGGRNTEFALAAAIELERRQLTNWTIASLATDGQDALTGVAGAIVDRQTSSRLREAGFDPIREVVTNNSYPGLNQIGATVVTGPTGTNVNDVYIALRNETA